MLNGIVNRLRGQVRLRVEAPFPERALNLCGQQGIPFWDLRWETPTAFSCRCHRRDLAALGQLAERLGGSVEVTGREGAPFFLGRLRRRRALFWGLALGAAALFFGSFFIWDFTVEGCETVSREEVLRALEENGVHRGTFGFQLDGEDLRNHVLLELPELAWITVNVSGCRAHVQVRQRVAKPELVNQREPTNVTARIPGLVQQVQALDGVACVQPGTPVAKGTLLISGVEDTETVGARFLTGMGTVEARTWHTLTAVLPDQIRVERPGGTARTRYALVVGTKRIKFFPDSSGDGGNCDKIRSRRPWSLFGLPLPVTLVRETVRSVPETEHSVTAEEAQSRGRAVLEAYLHTQVDPYGTVESTLCGVRHQGGGWRVTLQAECVEEIGETVPIYLEESSGNDPVSKQE